MKDLETITKELVKWGEPPYDFFPQSPSSLGAFHDICPVKYYMTYISKQLKFKPTPQSEYGNRAHEALEKRVSIRQPFTDDFIKYEPIVETIMARPWEFKTELSLAINQDLEPTKFFDNEEGLLRCRIDLAMVKPSGTEAFILDYKTGKVKNNPMQLYLNGILFFINNPSVETIGLQYVWIEELDPWQSSPLVMHRERLDDYLLYMHNLIDPVKQAHETGIFEHKGSGLCMPSEKNHGIPWCCQ